MVIIEGKRPTDRHELSKLLRGVNDSFCFYDELSPRQKRRLRKGKYPF
jgi:hypothetical protein